MLSDAYIQQENDKRTAAVEEDFQSLERQLARRGVDAEALVRKAIDFRVAVPSWGVGAGGTRFGRFGFPGEPRSIFEKLEDCEAVFKLVRVTPGISLHIPWDRPENAGELRAFAGAKGLSFESMNSNTFQDQPGQRLSYKFGSLSHTNAQVRRQAVETISSASRSGGRWAPTPTRSGSATEEISPGSCTFAAPSIDISTA